MISKSVISNHEEAPMKYLNLYDDMNRKTYDGTKMTNIFQIGNTRFGRAWATASRRYQTCAEFYILLYSNQSHTKLPLVLLESLLFKNHLIYRL